MKWPVVDKTVSVQPKSGTYRDWKEQVALECSFKCVYCAIHEPHFGGARNFHVEHYRPRRKFLRLKNDIRNLFYSCCICNNFKSDDWPGEPTSNHSNIAFCNPGAIDFNVIFNISSDGIVSSRYLSCKYMIEKLYLNRPQLIMLRRFLKLVNQLNSELDNLYRLSDQLSKRRDSQSSRYLGLIVKEYAEAFKFLLRYCNQRPYSSNDLKRKHGN